MSITTTTITTTAITSTITTTTTTITMTTTPPHINMWPPQPFTHQHAITTHNENRSKQHVSCIIWALKELFYHFLHDFLILTNVLFYIQVLSTFLRVWKDRDNENGPKQCERHVIWALGEFFLFFFVFFYINYYMEGWECSTDEKRSPNNMFWVVWALHTQQPPNHLPQGGCRRAVMMLVGSRGSNRAWDASCLEP